MIYLSPISKRKYLYELRQQMGSWFDFGQSRFTGLIIGNFFYITNHSQYEWDRRYNNPKCRATGFVTKCGDETLVHTITTYGDFDLISMIKWLPLTFLIVCTKRISLPMPQAIGLAFAISALACTIVSIGTWFTERGHDNMYELRKLLENPMRFWADAEESE